MANVRWVPAGGVSRTVSLAKIFCGLPGRPVETVSWITRVADVSLRKPIQPASARPANAITARAARMRRWRKPGNMGEPHRTRSPGHRPADGPRPLRRRDPAPDLRTD